MDGPSGKVTRTLKTGGIIQAKLGSTRLPDKVLLPLPCNSKTSVLEHIIRRTQKVQMIDEIIVATSNRKRDDVLESLSRKLRVKCFRGDEQNVLSRFFFAAKKSNLDVIVRLTGDNPCIDHNLINSIIEFHIKKRNDYTATKHYPLGLNVEVISFKAMETAFNEASNFFEKEHVTSYIYKNPDTFKISFKEAPKKFYHPDIRITLDTEEDYALLCAVFDYLYPRNKFFATEDIIDLFKKKSWLKLINKKIMQKKIFSSLEEEIREAVRLCDLQDLKRAKEYLEHRLHEGFHNN